MLKQFIKVTATPNKYNARSSAFNLKPQLPTGLLHNPAPASTNPEITPRAFLPSQDERLSSPDYKPDGIISELNSFDYSPNIYTTPEPKNYNLTADNVKEIQLLRSQGVPRSEIASKFKISNHFVGVVSTPNVERALQHQKEVQKNVRRWGVKTKRANHVKEVRKSQWNQIA